MDESKLELKVGALLLAALLGTLALLYLMGELSFGSGGTLKVDFGHTGNVVRGAPVRLAGIDVGRVDKITLLAQRKDDQGEPMPVQMTLSLTTEAVQSLRKDAAVTVSSQGPLGEPYLELNPGAAKDPLPANSAVRGLDSPRIDVVSNRLARFLEASSKVLENDPDAIAHFVSGISGLTHTVDGVLTDNRDDVRAMVQELSAAAKDMRELSALAKSQMSPGGKANGLIDDASVTAKALRSDYPELSHKAQVALGGMAAISGGFTEDDNKKLKEAIARYTSAGNKLDGIAVRADRMLAKLEAGEGTLGKTLQDPQVYDDLRSLLSDLKKHPWKMLWKD
jgi:phospholipid/cholesterol/gamma-HCH transport system substrate-binding protein